MKLLKNKKFLIIAAVTVVVVIVGVVIAASRSGKKNYEYVLASKGDLRQEVSVTGRVKAAEEVDLALERSGRVASAPVKVGDHVVTGQTLVMLDSGDVAAQVRQAQAGVASAQAQLAQYQAALANQQAKLAELRQGTRSEDVAVSQAAVAKALQDLNNYYLSARNTINDAFAKANDAVRAKTSAIFNSNGTSYSFAFATCDSQSASDAATGRSVSETELQNWQQTGLPELNAVINQPGYDQQIIEAQIHLSKISNFLMSLNQVLTVPCALSNSTLDTYRTNVATGISNINTASTNVATIQQAISAQKATVEQRQNELLLKQAGSTPEQLAAQEATVRQAQASVDAQAAIVAQQQASVQNYQAQAAKNIIRAPFAGLVTKQDAKVGQVTSPNTPLVSLMSNNKYQIEANIPEADIAKVKLTDTASLTLDAYGSDVTFSAVVVAIDPAETLIDGVSTYKVTLEFTQPDERIRSGMTANIDILTDTRTNVLTIPQRSIISKNNAKVVQLLIDDHDQQTIKETTVTTGLVGVDGRVEILSGIQEGDRVTTGEVK